MKNFLQLVATSLCNKLSGEDFTQTIILFPNKRANLFLNKYLLEEREGDAMWAPTYMTISEFFKMLSMSEEADPIDTVCRIYKHYVKLTKSNDTLDYFYGWGERILSDFDDLDKNLGNAKEIFKDLKEYESIGSEDNIGDYLDEEQIEQLERFSKDFSLKNQTEVRQRFKQLWDAMLDIYTNVRAELEKENLAYEGQLFRQVLEKLKNDEALPPKNIKHIAVVGFNVLDKVEQELFATLEQKGYDMLYYWDYDTYYCSQLSPSGNKKEQSDFSGAGYFISKNIQRFGNELSPENFNNINEDKQSITFLSADTDAIQAQYTNNWLKDKKFEQNTAIVLCDENLLQPVLYALPSTKGNSDQSDKVNITKGYAVTHTIAYAEAVRELESAFRESGNNYIAIKDALNKLEEVRHSLREKAQSTNFKSLEVPHDIDKDDLSVDDSQTGSPSEGIEEKPLPWKEILHKESYYLIYKTIGRFENLIEKGKLSVDNSTHLFIQTYTLLKLIKQVLATQTIAFHGEPAVGLQIMGVLETRCLDFDNLLMLSVGEGILPQRNSEKSFIPFLIRERHGLTTYLRKNSVYSYYFYRLLQRSKNVTLVYNCSTSGTQRGEMSRFMSQMLIDPVFRHRITLKQLVSTPRPSEPEDAGLYRRDVEKPICTAFSPSSLNTYLSCKRKFYYEKKGLKMPQKVDGVIDPRDFGTLFHKCSELLFNALSRQGTQGVYTSELKQVRENKAIINRIISQAFNEVDVQHTKIVEDTVRHYLDLLLKYESNSAMSKTERFWLKATEKEVSTSLKIPFKNQLVNILVRGEIDRLDIAEMVDVSGEASNHLRIIDYKTGGSPATFVNVDALFDLHDGKNDQHYNFQTFLYSYMLKHMKTKGNDSEKAANDKLKAEIESLPVCLALYYIPKMSQPDFIPYLVQKSEKGKKKGVKTDNKEQLILDNREYADEFESRLKGLLEEIIDPDNQFERTSNSRNCKFCDFSMLCKKTANQ